MNLETLSGSQSWSFHVWEDTRGQKDHSPYGLPPRPRLFLRVVSAGCGQLAWASMAVMF